MQPLLLTKFTLRDLTFKNRIFVSPMCQYSAVEGVPTDWHMVHLGARAVGGAALVMAEATAVTPEGRISPEDTGLWNDKQSAAFAPITRFILEQGSVPAIQLAHAGRKASTAAPWNGGKPLSGASAWQTIGPSAVSFSDSYPAPRAMDKEEIASTVRDFRAAAERALSAGFQVVEIHMAHGYLLHEFLSPLSNRRDDQFGGSPENRMRFPLQVAKTVREFWPQKWPVFVRISSSDWADGGWDLPQSIVFAGELKKLGIDLIDCSSGGNVPHPKIPVGPGYQVPFAEAIRREAGIATGAVGLITEPEQADKIIAAGQADVAFLARELLRDPHWPLRAAKQLGGEVHWPKQYERARN